MSDQEVTPVVPEKDGAEGVQSPVADAQEVATAATEASHEAKPEKDDADRKLAAKLAFEAREAKRQAKAEADARMAVEAELQALREGKGAAPKAEDFDSYDSYLDARAEWLVEQKLREQSKKSAEERSKAEQAEAKAHKQARLQSVMDDGAKAYKDFGATLQALDSVVANPTEIQSALDCVLESDRAQDLIYFLGKNPSVVVRLAEMTPLQQAREIGRLEEKLQSKKLTAAPEPPQTVKGTGGRVTSDAPPADPAEYRKWRAKNLKR